MPGDDFYAAIESGRPGRSPSSRRAPCPALIVGGIPVLGGGHVAGATRVTGAMTGAQDRRIADVAVEGDTGDH
jgi:uncharacterized protein GlcG (DUF336 family)